MYIRKYLNKLSPPWHISSLHNCGKKMKQKSQGEKGNELALWTAVLQEAPVLLGREEKSPLKSRHTAICSFKLCCAPRLRRVCHWDPTQVIRILFKCVYWATTQISFIFTSTGDHRPPALFCLSRPTSYSYTCFILVTVRSLLWYTLVSLPKQSSCPDENVMLWMLLIKFRENER